MVLSILAIGDSYLPASDMANALDTLSDLGQVRYATVDADDRPVIEGLREYQGDPATIAGWVGDASVLVVHAAPVTRELLETNPGIRLIGCVRGGAVNIDLVAAQELGVAVVNTPAKNAVSVADLTMTVIHMLSRGIGPAAGWLRARAAAGETHLDSTFIGGEWIAAEPRGATLGIIGFGAIGQRVAAQAKFYGMNLLAYDPYFTGASKVAELVTLAQLRAAADVVSVHAKESPETHHLIDAEFIAGLKQGVLIVNTARQSLVDEAALLTGLRSGQVGGAALDVVEADGLWPELVAHPSVIITPHLGGATRQTQERGLQMIVGDIRRFVSGDPLRNRVV